VTTLSVQSRSKSCNAEILAGRSSNKNIDWSVLFRFDLCEVANVLYLGIVVSQHAAGKLINLRKESRFPSKRMPGHCCRFNAGAN
jgi:hypothetical protein